MFALDIAVLDPSMRSAQAQMSTSKSAHMSAPHEQCIASGLHLNTAGSYRAARDRITWLGNVSALFLRAGVVCSVV